MRQHLVFASTLLVLGTLTAHAHAFLDHASPQGGSSVHSAPHEVSLTFTQNLEPAFSTVEVTGSNDARVDQGKPQISGNVMRIGVKPLTAGSYTVRWHVLSVDTHRTEGSFSFSVEPDR
jgi:copper resistance protein C